MYERLKERSTERKRKKERDKTLSGKKKRENVDVRKGKYVKERAKGHTFAYIYT